jgi:NADP-dependent 3-hydroxy acid dehydrogenase YdfG
MFLKQLSHKCIKRKSGHIINIGSIAEKKFIQRQRIALPNMPLTPWSCHEGMDLNLRNSVGAIGPKAVEFSEVSSFKGDADRKINVYNSL